MDNVSDMGKFDLLICVNRIRIRTVECKVRPPNRENVR